MTYEEKFNTYKKSSSAVQTWVSIFEKMWDSDFANKKIDEFLAQVPRDEEVATPTTNPELEEAISKRKELYKQATRLHFLLQTHNENVLLQKPTITLQAVTQAAVELRETWLQIDELWTFEEYFKQHGKAPQKPQKIVLEIKEPLQLLKRRATLLTYLTPSYLIGRKSENTRAEFEARVRAELAEIDKQLSNEEDS